MPSDTTRSRRSAYRVAVLPKVFPLTLIACLAAGCVAQAEYDSALEDLDAARKATGLDSELQACHDELPTHRQEAKRSRACEARLTAVQ